MRSLVVALVLFPSLARAADAPKKDTAVVPLAASDKAAAEKAVVDATVAKALADATVVRFGPALTIGPRFLCIGRYEGTATVIGSVTDIKWCGEVSKETLKAVAAAAKK